MNLEGLGLFHWSVILVATMLTVGTVLAFARLVCGPSLPDRVVALDLIATLVMGIIATYAIAAGLPVFLDVAIVVALIAFLGTVAFAHYVEKGTLL